MFLLTAVAAPPEGTTIHGENVEKQLQILRGTNRSDAAPAGTGYDLSHKVDFQVGATQLHEGDNITVDEVIGTSDKIEKGNVYLVKGTYRLLSQDSAQLSAYVTTGGNSSMCGSVPSQKTQSVMIDKGKGRYSLIFYMWDEGWPHLSYYPAKGGSSFSAVYFGTGDSLLKRGWWEKDKDDAEAAEKK